MTSMLVAGDAVGPILVLDDALSFWGGVDAGTGQIIDGAHPQHGSSVTGAILAMPHGRGSSSSATVVAEAIRRGTGPAGFLLGSPDEIIVTGVFVANSLYGTTVPVVVGRPPNNRKGLFRLSSEGLAPVSVD